MASNFAGLEFNQDSPAGSDVEVTHVTWPGPESAGLQGQKCLLDIVDVSETRLTQEKEHSDLLSI